MVKWKRQWESWEGLRGGWGMATTHHPPAALSVFWVQVLLAGLVVPLLLGATLTYTYRRCQLCKAMVPGKRTRAHVPRGLGSGWVAQSPFSLMQWGKLRQGVLGVGAERRRFRRLAWWSWTWMRGGAG